MNRFLKIALYTLLTLSFLFFVLGVLVFSYPFFQNTYADLLVKWSTAEPNGFDYQIYSREEFALKYLNTSLTPQDDFISLYENYYEIGNSDIMFIVYDIPDPE
jgi:hypothetical protein